MAEGRLIVRGATVSQRYRCKACSEDRHTDCSGWCFCECADLVTVEQVRMENATAEAFMAGARCCRQNAVEIAREGITPAYLVEAGFKVVQA